MYTLINFTLQLLYICLELIVHFSLPHNGFVLGIILNPDLKCEPDDLGADKIVIH